MRRLILEEWLSLDGYAVDAAGTLNFFPAADTDKFSDAEQLEFLEGVDTILLGRKTYELFIGYWPQATTKTEAIADRLNSLPKRVFSKTLREAPWGKWAPAEVVRGEAVAQVRRLKALPGKDLVLWGSVSLAQTLMQADLIDEYHLQLCPTLVGGGRRLFAEREAYAQLRHRPPRGPLGRGERALRAPTPVTDSGACAQ